MHKAALLVCAILAGVPAATAQQPAAPDVRYDSSAVVLRTPAPDALHVYLDDPAFRYDREPPEPVSWWDRFVAWLREKIFGPLGEMNLGPVLRWFFYALAAFGLFFAVTRLLRMDAGGVFYGKRKAPGPAFETVEADLREIDFDRQIDEAVAARDFRRAIRLLYLKTLKTLAVRELIDWQRDKTNHAYVDELRRPALRTPFAALTDLFEYVWYGDFPVDEAAFGRFRGAFARFGEQVQEG